MTYTRNMERIERLLMAYETALVAGINAIPSRNELMAAIRAAVANGSCIS
jgi:hypothetical protein